MKNVHGFWLPDHEEHLLHFAKGPGWTYQAHKLIRALEHVKRFDCAIDVGGHCGLWSIALKEVFAHVHAFEPVSAHRECFEKNVSSENVTLYPYALGEKDGTCSIHTTEGSSGDSWVDGEGDIPVKKLDDFDMNPDFIKLDCEGYEYFALKGAEQTLKRCRPTVIVEQKPGKAQTFGLRETQAVEYLEGMGWKLKDTISGDYILAYKGR